MRNFWPGLSFNRRWFAATAQVSNNIGTARRSPLANDKLLASLLLAASAVTGSLCIWQSKRYFWKKELIETEKSNLLAAPAQAPQFTSQDEYSNWAAENTGKRAILKGNFLHEYELRLGPRGGHKGLGMSTPPMGYLIITPFRSIDGTISYINRGWVPLRSTEFNRPRGQVSVSVVFTPPEKEPKYAAPILPGSKVLIWLDKSIIAKESGFADAAKLPVDSIVTAEIIRDPFVDPPTDHPTPRRVTDVESTHYVLPQTHATYALSWGCLCTFALILATKMKRKPTRNVITRP